MSIAALALASTMPISGDMPGAAYLKAAEEAFAFLEAHNTELLNDGKENILDDCWCPHGSNRTLSRYQQRDLQGSSRSPRRPSDGPSYNLREIPGLLARG